MTQTAYLVAEIRRLKDELRTAQMNATITSLESRKKQVATDFLVAAFQTVEEVPVNRYNGIMAHFHDLLK